MKHHLNSRHESAPTESKRETERDRERERERERGREGERERGREGERERGREGERERGREGERERGREGERERRQIFERLFNAESSWPLIQNATLAGIAMQSACLPSRFLLESSAKTTRLSTHLGDGVQILAPKTSCVIQAAAQKRCPP